MTVQFPRILGNFTNSWKEDRLTPSAVEMYALWLFLVGAGYVLLYGYGQFRNGQLGRLFEYQLRRRLFLHWETLSTGSFRQRSIGDLLNHAMTDVRQVREALSGGLNILTNAIFLLLAALYMTFRTISVSLTLVSMIPLVFVPLFVVWWGPRIRASSKSVQEALSEMADLTEESLSAIRLIKATANEAVEAERFEQRVENIVHRQVQLFRQSALFQSLIPLMGSISFGIALLYGGFLTINGAITLGSFVAFTLYLAMLIQPLQQIGFVINNFQRASASLARLSVLLSEEPEIANPIKPVNIEAIRGDIQVCLGAFQYPDADEPVLKDIVFSLKQGQTLGIVGRTAAGKSTLVHLLPRVFDPPDGSVFIDGVDVRDIRLSTLREGIALVPQDGFLFSTTLRENIGFAKASPNAGEVEEAAKHACVYDDILRFKNGFDTIIGERGVTLSGGQKQRTALARALLKDAPILILDDSLSAVDMSTEKRIIDTLKEVRKGKTTIIIAHRLSAVVHSDWIILLDEGRIVEQGTHASLIKQKGLYAQTFELQQSTEGATV